MKKLRELQENFGRHIHGLKTIPNISDQVKFNSINNLRRLQVYQNNFKTVLTGALSSIYPVVEKLVGERFFAYTCAEFIQQYPSHKGNLHDYGEQFPAFLSQFEAARTLDYLADVAEFEWAYHQVFHAADSAVLNLEKLQQVEASNYEFIHFRLHPARYLIHSQYPVLKIWQANQHDTVENIQLDQADYYYLIFRHELQIMFQRLEKTNYQFLQCIQLGQSLGQISTQLFDHDEKTDNLQADLQQMLIQNVSAGHLSGFTINQLT